MNYTLVVSWGADPVWEYPTGRDGVACTAAQSAMNGFDHVTCTVFEVVVIATTAVQCGSNGAVYTCTCRSGAPV